MSRIYDIAVKAFKKTTDKLKFCREKWICDETFSRLINSNYNFPDDLKLTRELLNSALLHKKGRTLDDFTITNTEGIFWQQYKTETPYEPERRRQVTFYYVTDYRSWKSMQKASLEIEKV